MPASISRVVFVTTPFHSPSPPSAPFHLSSFLSQTPTQLDTTLPTSMQLKRLLTSALILHPRYFWGRILPGSYISGSGSGCGMEHSGVATALRQLNEGGKKYLLSPVVNHSMCLSTKEIGKDLPFPFPESIREDN